MPQKIKLQPAEQADHRLPYPFFVDEQGSIGRQDVWKGAPAGVVGFVSDPNRFTIELPWPQAWEHPERAEGMYVVTENEDGSMDTHIHPIESATVVWTRAALSAS